MFQLDLEQRQSTRFTRPFKVTNREDDAFVLAFQGFDINLTGIGFWVDEADLFYPGQLLSLQVHNIQLDECYYLEGVEVVHILVKPEGTLCGCHITRVTSPQLLAHHRLVMTDQETALISMQDSQLSEFNFVESGSPLSLDEGDFQEASMALNLAVAQSEANQKEVQRFLTSAQTIFEGPFKDSEKLSDLADEFQDFKLYLLKMNETTIAFAILAKLLAHTPNNPKDKQAWKTLISDFEDRFLSEKQQIAYDFMHQGLTAQEAIELAEEYLAKQPKSE